MCGQSAKSRENPLHTIENVPKHKAGLKSHFPEGRQVQEEEQMILCLPWRIKASSLGFALPPEHAGSGVTKQRVFHARAA